MGADAFMVRLLCAGAAMASEEDAAATAADAAAAAAFVDAFDFDVATTAGPPVASATSLANTGFTTGAPAFTLAFASGVEREKPCA